MISPQKEPLQTSKGLTVTKIVCMLYATVSGLNKSHTFCYNAVSRNVSWQFDDCIRRLLALGSRDQATTDDTCSSFMTSLMAEFVSGALRTSVSLISNHKALRITFLVSSSIALHFIRSSFETLLDFRLCVKVVK